MTPQTFWIDPSIGMAGVSRACQAILDHYRDRLGYAFIDGFSDLELPEEAQGGLRKLEQLAKRRNEELLRGGWWSRWRARGGPI
jgi:hypothetical protein